MLHNIQSSSGSSGRDPVHKRSRTFTNVHERRSRSVQQIRDPGDPVHERDPFMNVQFTFSSAGFPNERETLTSTSIPSTP